MNVNIWGDAKKDRVANKNYVGYIPSDYENYGFKIYVESYRCDGEGINAREPYELDITGHLRYEFHITCPDSVKMWKLSYKLTNTTSVSMVSYPLKYILKGSNDNSNWITFYNSIVREQIITEKEFRIIGGTFTKSVFPNILIENPKSYKYYMFIVTFDNPISSEECIRPTFDIDTILKAVVISNPQLYIMNV